MSASAERSGTATPTAAARDGRSERRRDGRSKRRRDGVSHVVCWPAGAASVGAQVRMALLVTETRDACPQRMRCAGTRVTRVQAGAVFVGERERAWRC